MKLPLKCDYYHFYVEEGIDNIVYYSLDGIIKRLKFSGPATIDIILKILEGRNINYRYVYDKEAFEEDTEAFLKEYKADITESFKELNK